MPIFENYTLKKIGRKPSQQPVREIQFAANAEWPHTDPANAGIRAEFQLPPNHVMK